MNRPGIAYLWGEWGEWGEEHLALNIRDGLADLDLPVFLAWGRFD